MPDLTLDALHNHARSGTMAKLILVASMEIRSLVSGVTETIWVSGAPLGGYGWSEATQALPCLTVPKGIGSSVGSPVGGSTASEGILSTIAKLSDARFELVDFESKGGSARHGELFINGVVIAGSRTIALDGMKAGVTIMRGERFSCSGLAGYVFTVLEDVVAAGGGGIVSLDIWPSVPAAGIADNARVTLKDRTGILWMAAFTITGDVSLYYVGEAGGDGPDAGDKVPWANRGTIATGMTARTAKPSISGLEPRAGAPPPLVSIDLKPPGSKALNRHLRRQYTGHGICLYCNGLNTTANAGDAWDPEDEASDSFVILARVFIPGDPPNWPSGTSPGAIIDKNHWRLRRGTVAQNDFRAFIETTTSTYTAVSPDLEELEQWYIVALEYKKIAETLRCGTMKGHPTAERRIFWGTTVVTAGTLISGLDDLRIGSMYDGALPLWGIIGWVRILTGEHSEETLVENILAPLEAGAGAADGVVANWQNVSLDGTVFLDEGPHFDANSTPTSIFEAAINTLIVFDALAVVDEGSGKSGLPATAHPIIQGSTILLTGTVNYDGPRFVDSVSANEIVIIAPFTAETFTGVETFQDITAAHNLEGGDSLEGSQQPYFLGGVTNGEAIPAASGSDQWLDFNIFDAGERFSVFSAVRDNGPALIEQGSGVSLMELFTTNVTAGKFLAYTLGGKVLLGQAPNGAVTIDGWGMTPFFSGWRLDGLDDQIDFSTGINGTLANPYTMEMAIAPLEITTGLYGAWSNTGDFQAEYVKIAGSLNERFRVRFKTTATSLDLVSDRITHGHGVLMSLVVNEIAGDVNGTLYQDGVVVDSKTSMSDTIEAPGSSLRIGQNQAGNFFKCVVSELRFWNVARTQSEIQSLMAGPINSPSALTALEHYYAPPYGVDAAQWADTGNGTPQIGSPSGSPSIGAAPAISGPQLILKRGIDIAGAALDLSLSAGIATESLSIDARVDETLISVLSRALQGASAWLIFDPSTSSWVLRRFPDVGSASPDHLLRVNNLSRGISSAGGIQAPHVIAFGWRPVSLVQTDLPSTVRESRRALVSKALRYSGRAVRGAVAAFPNADERLQRPSAWRHRRAAKDEENRIVQLVTEGLVWKSVATTYGVNIPRAGDIIEVDEGGASAPWKGVALSVQPSNDYTTLLLSTIGVE